MEKFGLGTNAAMLWSSTGHYPADRIGLHWLDSDSDPHESSLPG